MTTHFTFFESYYSSVKDLDANIKAEFYEAIFKYALYDEEPTESVNAVVKALFNMAKPNLDSSKAKREAGKQGGSKPKQTQSDKEKDKDKELLKKDPLFKLLTMRDEDLKIKVIEKVKEYKAINIQALAEWLNSKNYKDIRGITKLLNMLSKYQEDIQQEIVDTSLMNNYQGLFEPKANNPIQSQEITLKPNTIYKTKPTGLIPAGYELKAVFDAMGNTECWRVVESEGLV